MIRLKVVMLLLRELVLFVDLREEEIWSGLPMRESAGGSANFWIRAAAAEIA